MFKGKLEFYNFGSKEIKISETEVKLCNFYGIKPTLKKNKTVNHHILLVDVSFSMSSEMENLKEKLKEILKSLADINNCYVSIILYAGHEQSYRIVNGVKCDVISYEMAEVYKAIDNEVYPRGVTVMSEPLSKALDIVKNLCNICDKHNILLLTDGYLVPINWNYAEEEERCLNIANYCKEENIFLNTLGFGQYYDRKFLTKLTSTCGNGSFVHIDELEDYSKQVLSIANDGLNKDAFKISISGNDYFIVNESKRVNGETILKSLNLNEINIIASFDCELTFENVNVINKKINKNIVEDFLYSLLLYHVINEDIDSAEIVSAQIGNRKVFDSVSNCYSFIEKGKAIKTISEFISNKDLRKSYPIENIHVPTLEEEPVCLLEIIKKILNDKKSSLLWDLKYKYKRIGLKSKNIDDTLKFIPKDKDYGVVTALSIGSSKLNIGVKVCLEGSVQNINSKLKLDCKVFKDYNLLLNGNTNTDKISCILSKTLRDEFKSYGILIKNTKWNGRTVSHLDISKIKGTNKRLFKSMSSTEVGEGIYNLEVLKCKQWALNKAIETIEKDYDISKMSTIEVHEEEKLARMNFSVDSNGIFSPKKISNLGDGPYEIYSAFYLEWNVESFPQKKLKEEFLKEYIQLINPKKIQVSYNKLLKLQQDLRKEIRSLETSINIVRISSALCNKSIFIWDDEYFKDKKQNDKVLNQNMIVDGRALVSTKNLGAFSIRQLKYAVLTKCN